MDYVIVGAGSAGCVLAARLSEDPGVQVTLLEAGPVDKSVLLHCPAGLALLARLGSANWGFQTVPQAGLGGRRGYQPRGKVLGGSSSVNAMIYMRGAPEDYDAWAAEGNAGWGWDEVLPVFRRGEDNLRGADAWHGTGGPLHVMDLCDPNPYAHAFVQAGVQAGHAHNPDFNGASQEGVGLYQVTHKAGERFSAAKAYLAPHRQRPNLHVITGAHATRVLLQGQRAVGVAYRHGGQERTLHAEREVVLSAGAFQSPQLLMLSGIGPGAHLREHGLPVALDLPGVGAHLHDHPDVVQVWDVPGARELFGLSPAGAWRTVGDIRRWRRERRGPLTTNFAEAGGFIRSEPGEPRPDLQLHFVVGKLVNHGRTAVPGHGFSCHVCVLRPRSRGSVRLASSNPLAAPLIDPAFLQEPDDLRRLVAGFKRMRELLSQPALTGRGARETSAGVRSDAEIQAFIRQHADTIYHPVGSCRMGSGAMDVVDSRLRVHGIERLRVVDASVMPSVVSGNTNAPTLMIAERAAAWMKEAA
ncbi:GMC family oxidoreductase [Comamonas flocculans]|uniref:Glucose-methanol-choline oxidoreductase n=1 Tax=Comamonas flocculans TaxID=2597701 RepID=A0A5B8RVJ7_9BURK|nr:GMC family oxidoreductase N-terminal domain-containing protein [Comamonas flocculans]QEA13510.1 glucose-methanol-choline oxidoreductase [Comamonas flocculans]